MTMVATPLSLGFVYALTIALSDVPVLRHDWGTWPHTWVQVQAFLIGSWSGWDPTGYGSPAPYPNSYLIALPMSVLMLALGTHLGLLALLWSIGFGCCRAGQFLASAIGARPLGQTIIGCFCLFNPWVYNKTVAGHLSMIVAYAATIALLAELLGRPPSRRRVAVYLAITFAQLQFFLIACGAVALGMQRRAWGPLAFATIVALPTLIGVLSSWHAIREIPYTLAWQRNQSVSFLDGARLTGYFTHYDRALGLAGPWAVAAILAAITVGATLGRVRIAGVGLLSAFIILAITAGTSGPAAGPYAWVAQHVHATILYRELYDLIGYVVVAYAVAMSALIARFPRAGRFFAIPSLVLLAAWLFWPPVTWFVGARSVGVSEIPADGPRRFALLPAFQPLSWHGKGSGLDPDAFVREGPALPLNQIASRYPETSALAALSQGDIDPVRRLSVTAVVRRAGYNMADLPHSRSLPRTTLKIIASALPIVGLAGSPALVSVPGQIGDENIFIGDLPSNNVAYRRVLPVPVPHREIDARIAWVDASLVYAHSPAFAQPFGGAYTESNAILELPSGGHYALVRVRGALADGVTRVVADTPLTWVRLAKEPHRIICYGACVVAAITDRAPEASLRAPPRSLRPLSATSLSPWLWIARPLLSDRGTLVLNERYDAAWMAFADGSPLEHLRLDAAGNGWILQRSARDVVIVDIVALLQTLFELFGVAAIGALIVSLRSDRL